MLTGEQSSDIFVKGYVKGKGEDDEATDVHYRYRLNTDASFHIWLSEGLCEWLCEWLCEGLCEGKGEDDEATDVHYRYWLNTDASFHIWLSEGL